MKNRFIFDLDGTILDSDFSNEIKYFKNILQDQDYNTFIPKIPKLLEKYESTFKRYDTEDLKSFLNNETGLNFTSSMLNSWYESLIPDNYKEVEGIKDVLEYLKAKNKSIVVLSNWFTFTQKERLKEADLLKYFDEVYGGDIYLKPRKEAFSLACGIYHKEDCLMIGDNLEIDILGANMNGIDALFYNPNNIDISNKMIKNTKDIKKIKVKSINNMNKIKEMF